MYQEERYGDVRGDRDEVHEQGGDPGCASGSVAGFGADKLGIGRTGNCSESEGCTRICDDVVRLSCSCIVRSARE